MKFKHGTRRRALQYEKDWAERWKANTTFEQSVEQRSADNAYVFYDGPPFITGVPHHGTLLSSIVKDAVPRYWTMKGKRVERVWGWDCHGLPAENFVEKQLNITDRRQIVTCSDCTPPLDKDGQPLPTISLEKYITKARESMVANSESWQGVIDRIGRWVDFKGAYRTMDKDFMESVWWAFKQLYEAGKIYEGEKVLMYDTKFATPVSKAEVTMDNDAYQTVTDPSLYAKFVLADTPDVAILAWTTTPWTLPANLMLAVSPELTYCEVLVDGEKLVIAEEALERTLKDEKNKPLAYEVLRKFSGSELVGKAYQPLDTGSTWPDNDKIHHIYAADFVSHESGTGIVHIAPAYGEDDFELAKSHGVAAFHVIDDNGYYTDTIYQGKEVWD
ncbi:MAG: class I tRNA ligase family protein, partial [Candidatus Saccharibacteria bacterium]|nr:class I tRNA ligase family protein [Candidatus Saccharibacteria bacterium]